MAQKGSIDSKKLQIGSGICLMMKVSGWLEQKNDHIHAGSRLQKKKPSLMAHNGSKRLKNGSGIGNRGSRGNGSPFGNQPSC